MRDMTKGSPLKHLIEYAVPLLLGNSFQLAYNTIDSIIAGRFIGREALAAEGVAGPLMNLIILAVSGICIGSSVMMAEAYGAKDYPKLRKSFATTLRFGFILCFAVTLLCILLTPFILDVLSVPEDIRDLSATYLRIIFLGVPFSFFFNALSSALKSVGDSKTPLKFLTFSSLLNAVLDIFFLGLLHFGIVCSATTTVVAQVVSALLSGYYLFNNFGELAPQKEDFEYDADLLKKLISYAAPTALQQSIQPIGKVLIQSRVNALGINVIAAFNAVSRFDDFACIPEQSISTAISTYIAQNRGGKKFERIRPGFRNGIGLEVSYWLLIGTATLLLRGPLVSLFVAGDGSKEIIRLGSEYLGYMAFVYLFPALTNGFQGFYRGMGKMYTTIIGTFLQVSVRTAATYVLSAQNGIKGIAFACALGWSLMLLFEIPYYFYTCKKKGLQ